MNAPLVASKDWIASLKGVTMRLLPWLIPTASLALFLWWFCTIPMKPMPRLPESWTPGCSEIDVTWQTRAVAQSNRSSINLIGAVPGHPNEMLLVERDGRQSMRCRRVAMSTGDILAESAPMPKSTRFEFRYGFLCVLEPSSTPSLRLHTLDPMTLQTDLDMTLAAPSTTQDGNPVIWGLAAYALDRTGELHGILSRRVTPNQMSELFWVRIDQNGIVETPEQSLCKDCTVRLWPSTEPRFGILDPWRDEPLFAIDWETGEPVALPSDLPDELLAGSTPSAPIRLSTPSRGYAAADVLRNPTPYPRIDAELSIARVAIDQDELEADAMLTVWERLSAGFARLHHWTLSQLHSEASMARLTRRSIRMEALVLRQTSAEGNINRQLNGDVARTEAIECEQYWLTTRDSTQLMLDAEQLQMAAPYLESATWPVISVPMNMMVIPTENGAIFVGQIINEPPKSLGVTGPIWRIGILDIDATDVRWLGWMRLPQNVDTNRPDLFWGNIRVTRSGDTLLLTHGGRRQPAGKVAPKLDFPFAWTTIPVPPDLDGLRLDSAD